MLKTVRCVSTHPEDLADGRTIEPGGAAENVDIVANARLIREQRLIVEGVAASEVDQILTDAESAEPELELGESAGEPAEPEPEAPPARPRAKKSTTTSDEEVSE